MGWRIRLIAEAMNIDARGKSVEELSEIIVDRLHRLTELLGIPTRLREIGVARDTIPTLASKLLSLERLLKRNTRTVTLDEALNLLGDMW
jgi:lactaldehyde reductase